MIALEHLGVEYTAFDPSQWEQDTDEDMMFALRSMSPAL